VPQRHSFAFEFDKIHSERRCQKSGNIFYSTVLYRASSAASEAGTSPSSGFRMALPL